ncbi:hypothetical protein IC608_02405 [Devosia sp. PTR5]|uniref:Polyketide cyclase n=1 Tax=Devosia oryzisoli TaxID=2774138 RepID=A0A927FT89_9HYPH|nr:hypothetical protein [Devosia oryzisoli]MBD8064328.1 hypothetical protein [Devosia oryzisoli]
MSETDTLVFETALEASPEKVWRALSIPEYRDRWLQPTRDVTLDLVTAEVNSLLTFRWSERAPGQGDGIEVSLVTFELAPDENGGTRFRLTHAPLSIPAAANGNAPRSPTMLRAA